MRHFSSKGEGRCQKRNGNGAKRRVASRGFTGDIRIDIGAYRDLHRHRRCHKFRQSYSGRLGFDTPALVEEAGATAVYREAMEAALAAMQGLPAPGAHYLLPFGARGRFLFKMDFAEAEYIARVRSGVKGHFSYRQIAWEMKLKMEQLEPELGRLMQATPPWVEDMLKRRVGIPPDLSGWAWGPRIVMQ